jgi:hypothetical protein
MITEEQKSLLLALLGAPLTMENLCAKLEKEKEQVKDQLYLARFFGWVEKLPLIVDGERVIYYRITFQGKQKYMGDSSTCQCQICHRNRQFKEVIERVPAQDKEFWKAIFDRLFNVENDRDYYKAVVEGTWPNADKVIHDHRSAK